MLLPESASTIAPLVDNIFWAIVWLTSVIFVLVQLSLIIFVWKYHHSRHPKAEYIHGHTAAEVIWTVIPILILIVLTIASQKAWGTIRGPVPEGAIPIKVVAEQFAWNIQYPGPDGAFDTEDDVITMNEMYAPVNTPLDLTISSKDVIHSFFVPEFRIKQDAVPGLNIKAWIEPNSTGSYEIMCAELCGLGHYRMRGTIDVGDDASFQAWLDENADY